MDDGLSPRELVQAWCARGSAIVVMAMIIGATGPSGANEEADAAALDRSTTAVSSCSFDEMLSMTKGIPTVSGSNAAAICNTITKSLGHRPPVNVLRAAFKVTSLMSIGSSARASEPEIAHQLMNIVEARGITNPDRIMSTFDTVWKIFDGTSGHVTPRDLNIMLRSSGEMAHTLSDDGLISVGAFIWEQKKDAGG